MSDNYYATRTETILDNLDEDGLSVTVSKTTRIHIGKSNGGCAFMLHIYPDLGIQGEASMLSYLGEDGWTIQSDLYGIISMDTLLHHMALLEGTVQRSEFRVGGNHNCDYFTGSFS